MGEFTIGDDFTFSVTTHNASTGAAADADSLPTYRIYEENGNTAILTGSMAKQDDDNTTGCYVKKIAGTTANGFEAGKSYNVYVAATVGGISANCKFNYVCKAIKSLLENIQADVTAVKAEQDAITRLLGLSRKLKSATKKLLNKIS